MTRELILDPPRAVGPIAIGMPFGDAAALLRDLGGYRERRPGTPANPGVAHYDTGLSIAIESDADGLVHAVECYRPDRDVTVLFEGIAVFDLPADEVTHLLRAVHPIDVEDDGLTVIASGLLLAFGRPTLPDGPEDPDGRFFDSVLLAAPGYYEGPADTSVPNGASSPPSSGTERDTGQSPLF